MRVKPVVGFGTTVLRRELGAGMTVRNSETRKSCFRKCEGVRCYVISSEVCSC